MTTACFDSGRQLLWEWSVDPMTRAVTVPPGDAEEIRQVIAEADEVVCQSVLMEAEMLAAAGVVEEWPWHKTQDTLVAGHLLASGMPHNLTDMVLHYTGKNIKPFEERLKKAVIDARRVAGSKKFAAEQDTGDDPFGDAGKWRLAKEGDPMMPSAGSDAWHFDYWVPRELAKHLGHQEPARGCKHEWADDWCRLCEGHFWHVACSEYGLVDPAATLALWLRMRKELEERKLWAIYRESMRVPETLAGMETRGVSYHAAEGRRLRQEYEVEAEEYAAKCVSIAKELGYDLELAKGTGVNNSMRFFCFGYDECTCEDCGLTFHAAHGGFHECRNKKCKGTNLNVSFKRALDLPVTSFTDGGNPSFDADAVGHWLGTLDPEGKQREFVASLAAKRERGSYVTYEASYQRFGSPSGHDGYTVLHPSINQCGTQHLRMSSNNPNGQNVGRGKKPCNACGESGEVDGQTCRACKGEGEIDYNLRRAFCPLPGREFWAPDYENIELRIPAYHSGERAMIDLFERPDAPPFYGSQHLLNASVVYPDLFWPLADKKGEFKRRYAGSWYKRIKGFDFALGYQCGEAKGDATAGRKGAWRAIKSTFRLWDKLANDLLAFAQRHGYVETLPDKTVDPTRGYPIMTARSSYGDVSPTLPMCYFSSGCACWAQRKAMVRCHAQLKEWNDDLLRSANLYDATIGTRRKYLDVHGYFMALQIHDEILFDFPAGGVRNLARATRLRELMEMSGDDLGIPLRVSLSWHPRTWAESEELFARQAA